MHPVHAGAICSATTNPPDPPEHVVGLPGRAGNGLVKVTPVWTDRSGRLVVSALAALAVSAAGCSSNGHSTSGATTVATSDPAAAVGRVGSSGTGPLDTVPLQGPNASALQEVQYLTDAAEADPTLASYLQTNGDVATHALLTAERLSAPSSNAEAAWTMPWCRSRSGLEEWSPRPICQRLSPRSTRWKPWPCSPCAHRSRSWCRQRIGPRSRVWDRPCHMPRGSVTGGSHAFHPNDVLRLLTGRSKRVDLLS